MKLKTACSEILSQLKGLVEEIDPSEFVKPSAALSQSTIGQHLRHTLEFFLCLESGYSSGIINYDKRGHDRIIETNKTEALVTIQRIAAFIEAADLDRNLVLAVNYHPGEDHTQTMSTSVQREIVYNIEHAVHHMAIMKIGIREVSPYVKLPVEFGVAVSTIRHQKSSASFSA